MVERRRAGQGFEAADAGGDRLLGDDHEEAGLPGRAEVGAPAEFHAEGGDLDHPDLRAVAVAEEGQRAPAERLVERHHRGEDFAVRPDLLVHPAFDGLDLRRRERGEVGEVEPQAGGRHQRTGLFHMEPQDVPERGVEQVGHRVVAGGPGAAGGVHEGFEPLPGGDLALPDADRVHHQPVARPGVRDFRRSVRAAQEAPVADLPAALRIEGRLLQDHFARFAGSERGDPGRGAPGLRGIGGAEGGGHPGAVGLGRVVAEEPGLQAPHRGPVRGGLAGPGAGPTLPTAPRALPLLAHPLLEAVPVHRESALPRHFLHQVEGQPEGVVEAEGVRTGDLAGPGFAAGGEDAVQPGHGGGEGAGEPLLFEREDPADQVARPVEFGPGGFHLGDGRFRQGGQERGFEAGFPPVAERPAEDLPQHIAPPVVRREDPVGDEERRGAGVVGEDARSGEDRVRIGAGRRALADGGGQPGEEVGVVVGRRALHDRREPLQPQPGVHRRGGQGGEAALPVPVELHEDQVPDLQEPVVAGEVRALVVVDLRAGAAGAGVPHRPEVLGGRERGDPVLGDEGAPEALRLLVARRRGVAGEDADREPRRVEAEFPGQEFPGEGDRPLLEVVAEGEVPQHLEEGVVPGGEPHILEVVVLAPGADALLDGGGPGVFRRLPAQEAVLELVHPGVREQERRVVPGDERGTRDDPVVAGGEEVEEGAAEVRAAGRGGAHGEVSSNADGSGSPSVSASPRSAADTAARAASQVKPRPTSRRSRRSRRFRSA